MPPRNQTETKDKRWPSESYSASSEVPPSSLTTPELVISTMVPVPNELPLSLAIMVGEDSGVDVPSWKSNTKHIGPLGELELNRRIPIYLKLTMEKRIVVELLRQIDFNTD